MKQPEKMLVLIFAAYMIISFPVCSQPSAKTNPPEQIQNLAGNIYLFGEKHAVKTILKKEIEIWGKYYNNHGLRHLFVELPCFTAEYLNIWMHSEGDEILEKVYDEWEGTANHHPDVRLFYQSVKKQFPETIFHGTDVGHQYMTTGKRYLEYLAQHDKEASKKYCYAKKAIEQGKNFYEERDHAYRENMMAMNFNQEFNQLDNESVMGIYGSAHTGINSRDVSNSVPSMAAQLHKLYADRIIVEDLSGLAEGVDPIRIDTIQINGNDYKAYYYGRQNLEGFKNFKYRDFWQLEDAYDDFKLAKKTGDVLPYGNYPMKVETGHVFIIDYKKTDGTLTRKYYRSDGTIWNNRPSTEEFVVE